MKDGDALLPAVVIDSLGEEHCKALASQDFSKITDAPTIIRNSSLVKPKDGVPAYCRVQGDVTSQIEVDVRLPVHDWNGKFLAIANVVSDEACDTYLKRGYACMPVFRNFKNGRQDPEWAAARLNDLNTRLEANIAPHLLTLAGKAITSEYYSKPPERSYFMGCSAGGHYAMLEAQRFPWDYDGIVAGAPNLDTSDWLVRALWSARNWRDNDNKPILSADDLGILHRAVLDACDRDDGIEDGIVGSPVSCRFEPSSLLCTAGKQGACLVAPKVAAIERMYRGPPMPLLGLAKPTPNMLPGSEVLWGDLIRNAEKYSEAMIRQTVAPYFDLIFDHTHPRLTPANFNFERDYTRGHPTFIAVDNPDLRKFKSAGGKLIAYLGTNDTAYVNGIVDYYETVERTMGGRAATQDFFRFYMVPGMNHCSGGVGAYAIDHLGYLEAWVEESKAPDVMIGAHIEGARYAPEFPLGDATQIAFTRPVYPYPLYAKYKGSGDPNDAVNFIPVDPYQSH